MSSHAYFVPHATAAVLTSKLPSGGPASFPARHGERRVGQARSSRRRKKVSQCEYSMPVHGMFDKTLVRWAVYKQTTKEIQTANSSCTLKLLFHQEELGCTQARLNAVPRGFPPVAGYLRPAYRSTANLRARFVKDAAENLTLAYDERKQDGLFSFSHTNLSRQRPKGTSPALRLLSLAGSPPAPQLW